MSSEKAMAEVTKKIEDSYIKRTPKSGALAQKAKGYMPGGDTRISIYWPPYPLWFDKAEGCYLTDIDGNKYLDFNNCMTVLVIGHSHPKVMEAVRKHLSENRGTCHSGLMPIVIQWADLIKQRMSSFDTMRFVNSGTEAVMMAIRAARAFTGKDKILKVDSCYHGSCDQVVSPPTAPGLPKSVLTDTISIPFNDKDAAGEAITKNKDQLAAMIVEPIMGAGGLVCAKDDYLPFLRKVTAANNVLLILDEIVTFRLDYGGMQRVSGVKPDLTTLGKIIGGGFPAGAFGGRADIMNTYSPQAKMIQHGGTFNGNAVTATAGTATLELLTAKEIDRINGLGESLAKGMRDIFAKLKIKCQVTGRGSLQKYNFSPVPVVDGKTSAMGPKEIYHLLHLALFERGISIPERAQFAVSTPMTEKEINIALKALEDALIELRPSFEQIWPEIIG